MQITNRQPQRLNRQSTKPQANHADAGPSESVTLSSASPGAAAIFGGLGLIPVVGAVANFGIGIQASVNDESAASTAAGYGALANLAGTAVTAGGLAFGSDTAVKVGLGMIGLSGAAGAYAGLVAG